MREVGKGMARRLWAVVLSLALLLTMVPTVAFAEGTKTVTFVITDQATEQEITDASITITAPETGVSLSGYTAQLDESITEISYTVSKSGYQTASAANVAVTDGGTINVALSEDTVSVTVGATGNGTATVNGGASATVARNSSVQVDITPDEGWYVSGVTGLTGWGDSGFSGSVTAAEDMTIQVTFAQYLTVAVQETAGGSITVDKTSVKAGDTVTVTVTPNESNWITSVGGHTQLDFTDANKTGYSKSITITENTTLTAAFAEFFTVTVTGGEHGTVTAPEGGSISVMKATDTNITVSATPDTGYRVASVSVNGGAATTYSENDKTYSAVFSENTTVVITFAINTYDVTIPEETANGTVTADGTSAGYGSDVVITLTPDAGYDVDSVTVNGAPVSWTWSVQNKAEVTISGVTSNVTVGASFKAEAQIEDPGDITEETNPYAYIDLSGSLVADKYVFAKNAAVTLTAATGYTGVRVNGGTDDEVSASLTFTESVTIETVDLFDGAAWHRITLGEPLEITIDKAAAEGELIAPALAEGLTHYNSDVTLVATFTDISGISSVSYRVATNSDIENPTQSDAVYTYDDGDEVKFSCDVDITVDAELNDCDDVTVYVDITDRAGNTVTKEITLHINTVSPQVAVKISGQKDSDAQAGYFNTQRATIITITDRPSTFDGSRVSLVNKAENDAATMPTITEWQENEGVFTAQITFASEGNYDWEIQYTNKAGTADGDVEATAVAELTSDEPITEPVWQFTCDTTDPTGAQIGYATSFWNQLLSTLSFHTWLNYEVTPVVQGTQDNLTTPTDLKVEYYKDGGTTALIVLGDEGLASKTFSTEAPKINAGEIATVYARVTDKAGNEVYLSTDGIIIDNVKPTISTTPNDDTKAENYNTDVEITVSVEDSGNYSGIRHVEYWMVKDGTAESHITLYDFNYDGTNLTVTDWDSNTHSQKQAQVTAKEYLSYNDLKGTWEGKILVSAQDYNSSNVEVHVVASDNAGGEADEAVVHLDIDTAKPIVNVQYDAGNALNGTYFAATRTATVTITTRGNHFDSNSTTTAITNSITALDANHAAVANAWCFVDESGAAITDADQYWTPGTANSGADTDTFTAHIAFTGDANYTFQPSYTNEANNTNDGVIYADSESSTNESFTVDKTKPTDCKITVEESSWGSLLQKLTFGLYRNTTVTAVATGGDALSGIYAVEYYKVSDPSEILSEEELETLYHSTENPFVQQEITVDSDELFVAYARITDKAGNYCYMSTEGFAVDTKASTISVTVDEGYDAANGDATQCLGTYYHNIETVGEDGKIAVTIAVEDGEENTAYSGIRKVDYYLVKDNGNPSDATALYENPFTPATGTDVDNENHPTRSDLKRTYEETIQVDAAAYNSDDVKLYIHTVDNAGNENTKYVQLGIDVTRPAINVSYDNNVPLNEKYFGADRYATVTITERTSGFNAATATGTVADGITAKNLAGEDAAGTWAFVSAPSSQGKAVTGDAIWTAAQGNSNVDTDTFTAYIHFGGDADYTFQPAYTDAAGNENTDVTYGAGSAATVTFTVDATAPTADITLHSAPWSSGSDNGDKTFANDFRSALTYGIWTNQTVEISGTAGDVTSPIHKVEWVKVTYGVDGEKATPYTLEGLQAANLDWNLIAEANWTGTLLRQSFTVTQVNPAETEADITVGTENDQQFIIYLKVTDKAGNVAYFSTADVTAEDSRPGHHEGEEFVAPKVAIDVEKPESGIFAGDVPVAVSVIDPRVGDTYSGLKLVTYEIHSYDVDDTAHLTQSGTLFDVSQVESDKPIQSWTTVNEGEPDTRVVVNSSLNDSNKVVVTITAVDNAGNVSTNSESVMIDVTPPSVQVSYNNDNGDGTGNRFFKAPRTMTITVKERNFDEALFAYQITGIKTLTWQHSAATSGNGNATTHTATVSFSTDGEYQVAINPWKDIAGNTCKESGVTYNGTAPRDFVVDLTAPAVQVSYDNNDAANGNYYKADRVATITVTERNFDASRVTITGTATDDGVSVAFPTLSSWSDGGDNHTATLHYSGDALYNFDVAVSDQAGNNASDYAGDTFYVDKTMPELRIDGVSDRSANSDVVAPVITYSDTNFNENGVSIALVGVNGGEADYEGHYSSITHGQIFTYSDFAREKAVDDLYTLTAHVTDLAGNESVQSIFFSVNRFGSVYDLSSVKSILNKYLQNEQDIVFTETNVDSLDRESIRIVLTKNGIPTDLREGQDYTVTETGGGGQWSQYRYTIHKSLFAEDGRYSIAVYSVDAAGNINENIDEAKEAEISFGVDKTLPVIIPIDLESNTQYPTEDKTVDLEIKDNLVLQNVTIYIDGEETEYTVNGETYTFTIHESNRPREILIVAVDAAGNEYEMSVTNVLVSTNIFARYFNNKPLFYGSIGGVATVVAAVLILTKTHGVAAAAAGAGKKVAAGAGKKKKAGK